MEITWKDAFMGTRGQIGGLAWTSPISPFVPTSSTTLNSKKTRLGIPRVYTVLFKRLRPTQLWQPNDSQPNQNVCHFQALLTRLAKATERLKLVDGENAREALSTAIQLFR